jgi:hypothetical protein
VQVDAVIGGERRHVDEYQAHDAYEYQDVRSAGCLTRARNVVERCLYTALSFALVEERTPRARYLDGPTWQGIAYTYQHLRRHYQSLLISLTKEGLWDESFEQE